MDKIKEAYLDSSVFITSNLDDGVKGRKARSIINAVQQNVIRGYTATLTFDEVVYVIRKFGGIEKSLVVGENFLKIPHLKFIDVKYELILLAQELMKQYKIKPRDAIHAACVYSEGLKLIVSDDIDFDIIKEVQRVGIQDFKV